ELLGRVLGVEAIIAKIGASTEQMQALMIDVSGKIIAGDPSVTAPGETPAEHGVAVAQLQVVRGPLHGFEAILGKLGGLVARGGDGNSRCELGSIAKGLFG